MAGNYTILKSYNANGKRMMTVVNNDTGKTMNRSLATIRKWEASGAKTQLGATESNVKSIINKFNKYFKDVEKFYSKQPAHVQKFAYRYDKTYEQVSKTVRSVMGVLPEDFKGRISTSKSSIQNFMNKVKSGNVSMQKLSNLANQASLKASFKTVKTDDIKGDDDFQEKLEQRYIMSNKLKMNYEFSRDQFMNWWYDVIVKNGQEPTEGENNLFQLFGMRRSADFDELTKEYTSWYEQYGESIESRPNMFNPNDDWIMG